VNRACGTVWRTSPAIASEPFSTATVVMHNAANGCPVGVAAELI
jgi:hypothetical protein